MKIKASAGARKEAQKLANAYNMDVNEILVECQKDADDAYRMGAVKSNMILKHMVEAWNGANSPAGIGY